MLLVVGLLIGCPIFLAASSSANESKSLRHVVLFKFKDSSTPQDIKQIVAAFRALPGKIDTIKDFEWGTDVSVENKAQGFTHCFFVTFDDAQGRDAYLPHPAHKDFVNLAVPHIDKVLVFDYAAGK
jgi:hypothetical protein